MLRVWYVAHVSCLFVYCALFAHELRLLLLCLCEPTMVSFDQIRGLSFQTMYNMIRFIEKSTLLMTNEQQLVVNRHAGGVETQRSG